MDRLQTMTVFCRVVEKSSFSVAADELDLSSASVSRQIAALEDELGAKLLTRTTRKISITDAGQAYYEGAKRVLEEFDRTNRLAMTYGQVPKGLLRVSAPMSFGILFVAPLITEFLREHKDIQVDLIFDDRVVDLVADHFDVAVRIRTDLPDSGIKVRRLAEAKRVLCAAPAYLERNGTPVKPEQLIDHNCLEYVLSSTARSFWQLLTPDGEIQRARVAGNARMNNSLALLHSIKAGLGIGMMPRFVVTRELGRGELVEILPDYPPPSHSIHLVHRLDRLVPPSLQTLMDFMATRMKRIAEDGDI